MIACKNGQKLRLTSVTPPHNNLIKISKPAIFFFLPKEGPPYCIPAGLCLWHRRSWFSVCQWGRLIMPPVSVISGLQQTTHCTLQHSDSLRPSGGSTCGPFRPRGPANHNTTQSARPVMWDGLIFAFPFPPSYMLFFFPSHSSFPHWAKCKPAHIKTALIPRVSASIQISVCDTWQSRCRAVTHRRRRAPSLTWLVDKWGFFMNI